MKKIALSRLLPAFAGISGEAEGLHYDSRRIVPGWVFFAVPGFKEDGAKYLAKAFAQGAVAAVVKKGALVPDAFQDRVVAVENVRRALAEAAAAFYDHPARRLRIFGVTGTKGKTSSVYILDALFGAEGRSTALLGTVECRHPGRRMVSARTTMESVDLQAFLAEAVAAGAEVALMEVSSHALSLDRVWGIEFDGVLFTNLSEDHLDFYGDMENYYQAKKQLFLPPYRKPSAVAAANTDDPYGVRLVRDCPGRWLTFGAQSGEIRITQAVVSAGGSQFHLEGPGFGDLALETGLAGNFSLPNLAGAAAIAMGSGVSLEAVRRGILQARVPGRLEQVETSLPFTVFVDYAHMGLALESVLQSLRGLCQGRLIVVFGAGGDRPPDRRTQMGSVAARLADLTVITSDNPRSEDPLQIIAAIEGAFQKAGGKNCFVEADRRTAIRFALEQARAGDVVCIAGKGHETGQTIGSQTFPFDDKVEAAAVLRELERLAHS
jgi:UDP-N-acetylmuramoyl-L-alanyl-D-glutamate--2,6-diaminopimelate ligase